MSLSDTGTMAEADRFLSHLRCICIQVCNQESRLHSVWYINMVREPRHVVRVLTAELVVTTQIHSALAKPREDLSSEKHARRSQLPRRYESSRRDEPAQLNTISA
jgi:hypothetical protein